MTWASTGRVCGECSILAAAAARTIRWFLAGGSQAEFHGVDVDAEAILWYKTHLQRGYFLATAPNPPLPYPAEHFDVAYCLSVFTHLNESMQDAWLAELNRILKPKSGVRSQALAEAARPSAGLVSNLVALAGIHRQAALGMV